MAFRTVLLSAVLTCFSTLGALAGDVALVIANSNYNRATDVREPFALTATIQRLRREGFEVITDRNSSASDMRNLARRFADRSAANPTGRHLVILSGHFATSLGTPWLMAIGANTPDALEIGDRGLPVNALAEILSDAPGRAVMILAERNVPFPTGRGATRGIDHLTMPQGVTAIRIGADRTRGLVDALFSPGATMRELADTLGDGAQFSGLVSDRLSFAAPTGGQGSARAEDEAYWLAVTELNTDDALRAYLSRYPNGTHATEARRLLADTETRARERAEAAERALGLTRNQRREIQRDLTTLGHNTRGVDGLFGQGTRNAIANWQAEAGFDATGYLTRRQVSRLATQAAAREEEIAEQERVERLARERADCAYWARTGALGTETGYLTYLEVYPEGLFASEAEEALDEIQGRTDRRRDNAAWDAAKDDNTIEAYRAYLRDWPDGRHADKARKRINELRADEGDEALIARDRQQEQAVASNPFTRLMVERKLQALGYEPGAVDGGFDDNTRNAVRQFQRRNDIDVTGYVSQETLFKILASN